MDHILVVNIFIPTRVYILTCQHLGVRSGHAYPLYSKSYQDFNKTSFIHITNTKGANDGMSSFSTDFCVLPVIFVSIIYVTWHRKKGDISNNQIMRKSSFTTGMPYLLCLV